MVAAIDKVYVAKHELDSARKRKSETDQLMVALRSARAAGRDAVAALDQHKKEHGCKQNSGE